MAPRKLLVADLVGLTSRALENAPRIRNIIKNGFAGPMASVFPEVTCTAQASFLTGAPPSSHGIVGNGWYFRDLDEVLFWRQSRRLVGGETIFDTLRKAGKTTANLFGWYNWNSGADYCITPKPSYPADGAKYPGIHTEPAELRAAVEAEIGEFPLFDFWGPRAGIRSTRWIANSARHVIARHAPDFVFCYIPHLDYNHQRFGPDDPRSLAAIAELDAAAGELLEFARDRNYDILILSEYGITDVRRPVMLNRALRSQGLLRARVDPHVGELPLFGTSRAFAVCDHQIAHVYINDPRDVAGVRDLLISQKGVERVLDANEQKEIGVAHANAGELVAIADADSWFAYNYWLDDALAPDFARTVDIHRKPGYDPAELFVDPTIQFPNARAAWTLLKKKLGFRYLMKMIPLDPSMVRGSHGRTASDPSRGAFAGGSDARLAPPGRSIMELKSIIESFLTNK
ncbi:MAG: alkaline phosphatase family protein [Planctomycetes bacterium]|nr:alkaline phosphatase family protein [Planctomycetota bacterium]